MKKIKILGGIVLTIVLFFVIINVIPPKKNVKEKGVFSVSGKGKQIDFRHLYSANNML